MSDMNEIHRIDGRARTIRELLDGAHYTIDFYQREYAWEARQVQELIDDLSGKFLDYYREGHDREEVEGYGHYFLGSIVVSHKNSKRYIVDGQQRLTTLTLLLIHLHQLAQERDDVDSIETLIFSKRFGKRSFNIDVDERNACLDKLFTGETFDASDAKESVRNMSARYEDIQSNFPDELSGAALPYFVDWFRESVHIVEIEAYSDEDAYTIFETMNDRGLSLSLPEMLKGYILANIRSEDDQRRVNAIWKARMQEFKDLGGEEHVDFFKNWFRGRYAETARMVEKGAENKDYERIGSEFHRWLRDHKERLGLTDSKSFVRFVERDLDFYAHQTLRIRRAAQSMTEGLESIRFNEDRQFTSQTQVLLAVLVPTDSKADIDQKLALVADYLDIWLARRAWNFRDTSQSTVRYAIFNLCRRLRGLSIEELSTTLKADLVENDQDTFAKGPNLRLHQQNKRHVRHILARLTYWVDQQCGVATHFEDLVSKGKSKPFEIEHIWPNHPERYAGLFSHPSEFEKGRNRLGGLVLLQRGPNQSLGDLPYEKKRDAYVTQGQSLLTRSLHPLAYENNPAFGQFIERTGLAFEAHDGFQQEEQDARQELYLRIAEWVWNPSRVDLSSDDPPQPEPIAPPEDDVSSASLPKGELPRKRLAFWTKVIAASEKVGGMHGHLTPTRYYWQGAQEERLWWNFYITQTNLTVGLDISAFPKEINHQIFAAIKTQQAAIEQAWGEPLHWSKDSELKSRSIYVNLDGGWVNEDDWDEMAVKAVATMERLHALLKKPALEAKKAVLG